jgi:hypothetical protein
MNIVVPDNNYENKVRSLVVANPLLRPTSCIFTAGRDMTKTSDRYAKTNDLGVVESLNAAGFFVSAYKERKAHNGLNQEFKPYKAVYQNPSFGKLPDGTSFTVMQRGASDGTSKLILGGGLFRILCTNTMVVGSDLFKPVSIKHMGEVDEPLKDLVDRLIAMAPQVFDRVKAMSSKVLTQPQVLEFAERATALRFDTTEVTVDPRDLVRVRRDADSGDDLWRVFNRTQEALIRGGDYKTQSKTNKEDGTPRTPRKVSTVKNIELDWNINTQLWQLADQFMN